MPSRMQASVDFGVDMMAACRADALSKVYGRRDTAVHALREITLSIPAQAFTAIMGPSGSGKSTLLHCLAALDTPTSGRVFLGQTELTSLSRRQQAQVRRDRIGFVFQSFNLVPTLDAIENITLPQLLAGRRPEREWLEYVVTQIGLGDRLHHRPSQLSGGQQQRVALARALAGRPEVIFADEPTGNLDTRASREMLALLRSAVDDFRQTVVTVTHDPAIAGYADQVLFFTDGQVVDRVLQPETNLVLEHLQYLDSSTPAHVSPRGQLHASTQSDGQHTMRSRRRRRADETGPGRPMVGSDDEVEVARQERWLQRIREQFEAEHEVAQGDEPHDNGMANGYRPEVPAAHAGYDPAQPPDAYTDHDTGAARNGYHPDTAAPAAYNGYQAAETQALDALIDDDGWLPPERSWVTDTTASETSEYVEPVQPVAHVQQEPVRPVERMRPAEQMPPVQQTRPAEQMPPVEQTRPPRFTPRSAPPVPWSRPAPAAPAASEAQTPAPDADPWHTNDVTHHEQAQRWEPQAGDAGQGDEWLPADRYARDDDWHSEPPATVSELHQGATGRWSWREGTQEPAGVWPSSDAQREWSVDDHSQPPTGRWDARDEPEQHDDWQAQPHRTEPPHAYTEPSAATHTDRTSPDSSSQRWQPDPHVTPDDAAPPSTAPQPNGYSEPQPNGYDAPQPNGYSEPQPNGYDAPQPNGYSEPQPNGYSEPQPNGYSEPQPNGYSEPQPNGYDAPQPNGYSERANGQGDAPSHVHQQDDHNNDLYQGSIRLRPETPAPVMDADLNSGQWRVGKPAADGLDMGAHERGWSQPDERPDRPADDGDADDVIVEAEPFDIWSPSGVEETWTPTAPTAGDEQPHAETTVLFDTGPSDMQSYDAGPVADEVGPPASSPWQVDDTPLGQDPHHPVGDPQPHSDTATDPFEALQSLQAQLNRLGGHGRRPPRRSEE